MVVYNHDHVALDVSASSETIDKKRTKSLRRYWNQLSKCQRSFVYTVTAVVFLTVFYLVSYEPESAVISVNANGNENRKDILKNIRNDPRDVEPNFNEVVHENQVLEEPAGAEIDNNVNKNQVLLPPKVEQRFTGPTTIRQQAVVKAFKHAWKGYKKFAWGHDHLKPISEGYNDWFGLGLTIVDSLDTIFIMGLKEDTKPRSYDLKGSIGEFTRNQAFLILILTCLQERLMHQSGRLIAVRPEVTTIQLEFRDLSRATGDSKYENAVEKVSKLVHNLEKKDGLVPIFINANTGQFRSYATITLGARGDSYYEYLLKQWIQTGKVIDYLKDDYVTSIEGIEKHLVRRTVPNNFVFIGELLAGGKDFKPKMDHLTCYLPGTLALGVHHGLPKNHMKLADDLLTTCYQTYAQQPTFLAPEITYFNINIQGENSNDIYVKTNDAHNLLRPEFIESLWYMYQFTSNTTYQDWGWQIFQGFENYTRVVNGYTSIGNVRNTVSVRPKDMMESFFLSETLKYLYLLFSDNPKLLDLDKYVINSEAHPFTHTYNLINLVFWYGLVLLIVGLCKNKGEI
ncbi:hypothetical protein NQ314_011437 [Rhamnusium bicolor]|uniref:alpha-1,2-Mannosidase n=1 Tax=Rhamnusium bicolor TaxID=1586634 RepID=A0AAV8XKP7_9CUCU|nr:hypothetical protein NQ314_011437 [Rhamnusium bicolor]